MNGLFKSNSIAVAIAVAFPGFALPASATEPYPALPPTLSTSVAPNIMLYIDTSGSMLQDSNNNWMLTNLCNSNADWSGCVNNNTNNYRTQIDSEVTSPNTKMNTAKRVMRNLVSNNRSLRFGLFTFRDQPKSIGGNERGQAAILRRDIADISGGADCASNANCSALLTSISSVNGRTSTPLAEGLLEITRYFSGKSSLYGLGNYTSPIQYRCQKNFTIVVTDGDATDDQNLPGTGKAGGDGNAVIPAFSYTARNGSGGAVPETFSICKASNTTADDGYNVTCPSTYDGETTVRNFGDDSNRPSAVRDVAMYANRADLRVAGSDTEGVSFDDPKFSLQNMITYTIGFSTTNPVLPSTAKVGGGKSYLATNETALTNALNQAINSIAESTSNAGGVASMADVTASDNWIFQPVFNPKYWYGELRCFKSVNSDGSGVSCTPNGKASIPVYTSRKIYSAKVTGTPPSTTTSKFDFNSTNANSTTVMTTAQKTSLGGTDTERTNLVDFLRGKEGISGFRVRPKDMSGNTILLGDIIDAQPVVVAAPIGASDDASYASFKATNKDRGIVFIGANDGMLHAFKIGTTSTSNMSELMAYVPSAVYPHLAALKEPSYGISAGTPHTYHVNGTAQSLDVKISGTWKTLLAGGLGQGGQGYYTIDATNDATLGTNASIKWEWTDASDKDMGYSFGKPIIYNVRKDATSSQPAVILSNGYDNDYADGTAPGITEGKTSALYIVNADTGALIAKLSPPTGGGLSSPAGVDFGQDGVLDYVYAGDMNGKLWRFDLTGTTSTDFKVVSTPIFDAGPTHPISYRPSILAVNDSLGNAIGNLVLFGTGKLLTDSDRADTTVQSFYAVLDKIEANPTTISKSQLLQQAITETVTPAVVAGERPGTYRKVSRNEYDAGNALTFDLTSATETKRGWYMDLPVETERLVTSPLLIDDKLIFGTGIPKSDSQCLPGGKGWIMGLNPLTGSVVKTARGKGKEGYSFLDIHLDGKATDADKVLFSSGLGYISGYQKSGIPTELSYTTSSQKIGNPNTTGSLGTWGSGIAMRNVNYLGVYMANAADGTTKGDSMGVPAASGGGKIYSPVIGQEKVENDDLNAPPADGYKLQATTWREIK